MKIEEVQKHSKDTANLGSFSCQRTGIGRGRQCNPHCSRARRTGTSQRSTYNI